MAGALIARGPVFATALTALAFTAGCDDDDKNGSSNAPAPTNPQAELRAVRAMLGRAGEEYRAGHGAQAERTIGDAYLDHFEDVEGPLDKRDHALKETLEESISTTIRERMKAGAPVDEIQRLMGRTQRQLVQAEAALR